MAGKKCATKGDVKRAVHEHDAQRHRGQPKTRIKLGKGKR